MSDDNKKRIIIFSGTSEGRELSERLEAAGVEHFVCVASEFGKTVQKSGEKVHIREGRMDEREMAEFIGDDTEFVVDATHPYATEVSQNIIAALKGKTAKYIRVVREAAANDDENIRYFSDAASCARALCDVRGNILFTTGSRDISVLCEHIADKDRLFARVLPVPESIEECKRSGIRNDRIIAMTGPFSTAMNAAIISEYDISCLVTKDSGKNGGFREKTEAAREAGISCFCIRRPASESGYDVDSAFEELTAKNPFINIAIIGAGAGSEDGLTAEAKKRLSQADMVFGAERLLNIVRGKRIYPYYRASDIIPVLWDAIRKGKSRINAAVLFSGDISFYSGAGDFETGLYKWADENEVALDTRRLPGISSVSAFAARLGVPYQDALVISLHGRNDEQDIQTAAKRIAAADSAFVLLSEAYDATALDLELDLLGVTGEITVASKISYADEAMKTFKISKMPELDLSGPVIAYIKNEEPIRELLIPYKEDKEFSRDKTPMTKSVIRHECVRLLRLKKGDVLYDVGSGTGSVSMEAAALSGDIRVYSFEKKDSAIIDYNRNLYNFNQDNVTLVEKEAPEGFSGIEPPDAVFIGGSGGRLSDILEELRAFGKNIRVVITAVSVETRSALIELYDKEYVGDLKIMEISVSNAQKTGEYHIMRSENPVMIAAFDMSCKEV